MRMLVFLALPLLFCVPHTVAAQSRPTTEAEDQAKEHFNKGIQAYRLAKFAEALKHFQAAMTLSPRPSVFLNLAQCHRQLENHKKALFFYKLYRTEWVRRHPDAATPPFDAEVTRHIKALKEILDKPGTTAPGAVGPTAKQGEPAQRSTELHEGQEPPPAATAPTGPSEGSSTKQILGWTLVATGAALTITSVVLGVLASGKAKEVEEGAAPGTKDFAEFEDTESLGRSLGHGMVATLAIGLTAAVGGTVLLLLDRSDRLKRRSAWLTPLVAGGLGLSGGVRF